MEFLVCQSAHDPDDDSWASIQCPLTEGIHKISGHGDHIFDDPQWVVVARQKKQWLGATADSEAQAFDILVGRDGWGEELAPLKSSDNGLWLDKL